MQAGDRRQSPPKGPSATAAVRPLVRRSRCSSSGRSPRLPSSFRRRRRRLLPCTARACDDPAHMLNDDQPHRRLGRLRPRRHDRAGALQQRRAPRRWSRSTRSRLPCSMRPPRSRTRPSGPTPASTRWRIVSAAIDSVRGDARGASHHHPAAGAPAAAADRARAGPEQAGRAQDQGDHPVDPA